MVFDPVQAGQAYVLTRAAGILRTSDGGLTWDQLPLRRRAAAVTAVATGADGAVYAAASTGEYGGAAGRLMVAAAGDTAWRELAQVFGTREVGSCRLLRVEGAQAGLMFSYAVGSGFMRSEDGGATWDVLALADFGAWYSPPPVLVRAGAGAPTYYALEPRIATVFRSEDLGVTWTAVRRNAGALAADPADGDRLWAAELGGNALWRSTDGGATWQDLPAVASGEEALCLAAQPTEAGRLYAVTRTALHASADAGDTWTRLSPLALSPSGRQIRIEFEPADPQTVFLLADGIIRGSRDGGGHWSSLSTGFGEIPAINDIAVDQTGAGIVYAATTMGVYRLHWPVGPTAVTAATAGTPPSRPDLAQNYPNPFNGTTTIPYRLAAAEHVRLTLYDLAGQRVRVLVDGLQAAGPHAVTWDGNDPAGRAVGSGVYLCRLTLAHETQVRRLAVLR
ncbi:MAG: FlgD immunoglobulin-like domain containing protein [Candidatus Latescibacterota bacterium]